MKCIAIFCAANCLLAFTCMAQEFVPESSDDCLDRFQSMLLKVCRRYAVVGSATLTSTDQPHLSLTCEWFACEYGDRETPRRRYTESRNLYPHAPESNIWEKRYISGSQLYYSFGEYLGVLKEIKKGQNEEEEKFFRRGKSIGCPNLFSAAVLPPSGSTLVADTGDLVNVLNMLTLFDERRKGDDIVGKFYGSNFLSEIRFAKASGYLPTKALTYFSAPKKPGAGAPAPSEYKTPWHESETEWKRVGDDTWVPVRVSSILFRDSPNSKSGKEVEATATWDLAVEKSVLTDENVELLPEEGPVAEVRTKLLKVTKKSIGPGDR